MPASSEDAVVSFVDSPADSQVVSGQQFFKVYDDREYIYIRRRRINPHDMVAYRARKCDTYDLFCRTEMMHIPYHKRHLISNQRFSLSGYPCLYLGTSIYGCWEELERPDIDRFNITCMRNERLMHFADLTLFRLIAQEHFFH